MRKVEVVPHNPKWREAFEVESKQVTDALGKNVIAVHHIGSTAIPNIKSKPNIDLLDEDQDNVEVDKKNQLVTVDAIEADASQSSESSLINKLFRYFFPD